MLPDSVLRNPAAYRYVNHMLNIAYLTGFVRNPENGKGFLLQQNNQFEHSIPIAVASNVRLPADKTPATVLCHIEGTANADGEQNAILRAIDIQKPSIRAMPSMAAWRSGAKGKHQDEFKPFGPGGGLVQPLEDEEKKVAEFTGEEAILQDILKATKGRLDSRLGENANVVFLAGFVEAMAYIEGNKHQKGGYGLILLRQHKDPKECIPVRLYNPAARTIMNGLGHGYPISVVGQMRRKILPDDDGNIRNVNIHVRVPEIYSADRVKDIKETPAWWASMRDRLIGEAKAKKEAAADRAKAAPKAKTLDEL